MILAGAKSINTFHSITPSSLPSSFSKLDLSLPVHALPTLISAARNLIVANPS